MFILEPLGPTYRAIWGICRFVGLPHAESFTGLDLAPTPPASGTIRSRLCASWGPQGALRGTNGVSAEIVVTLGCEICYWLQPWTQNSSTREKRCRLCASWSPWGHLSGHMGYDMGRFHGTIKFRISIGLYINFVFSVL